MAGIVPHYFPDDEAFRRYQDRWRTRPLVGAHTVDIDDIGGFGQTDLLREMGWESLLALDAPVYGNLCRMFISNIDPESIHRHPFRFSTWMMGQRLQITSELICEVLGCPTVEDMQFGPHDGWQYKTWLDQRAAMGRVLGPRLQDHERMTFNDGRLHALRRRHIQLGVRPIEDIIQLILVPRIGHADEVNILDIVLLDCILQGRRVDIGALIIGHWFQVHAHSRTGIPHGMVITRLLHHFGLNLDDEVISFRQPNVINKGFLRRRSLYCTDAGDVFMTGRRASQNQPSQTQASETQVDDTQPPPPPPPPPPPYPPRSSDGAGPSQSTERTSASDPVITLLRDRITIIEETQLRMEERQIRMEERQIRMDTSLQRMEQRQRDMERTMTEALEILRTMRAEREDQADDVIDRISFDDL